MRQGGSEAVADAIRDAARHRLDDLFADHPAVCGPLLTQALVDGVEVDYTGAMLVRLGDVGLLDRARAHVTPAVRLRALDVLVRIDSEDAAEALAALLKDPDDTVQTQVRETLMRLRRRPPAPLSVRLLGGFGLRKGQAEIPMARWRRRRDRLLFAYLLLARQPAARDALVGALWPDLAPASATASLNMAWSALKRTLEPALPKGGGSAYLTLEEGRYGLRAAAITTDVAEFEGDIARADAASDLAGRVAHLEAAAARYRGDLLPDDANEPWTVVERERLRSLYLSVLERLADGKIQQGRLTEAADALRTVLRLESWREEAYRRLMRLLADMGRRSEALHLYRQCEALLRQELGVSPSQETTALFEAIASGQP